MRLLAGIRFSHVPLRVRNGRGYRLVRFLAREHDSFEGAAPTAKVKW